MHNKQNGLLNFIEVHCHFKNWVQLFKETWFQDYKMSLETSLKSQASDWLKWLLVTISTNQMLEI
jgi:hypothetical protein